VLIGEPGVGKTAIVKASRNALFPATFRTFETKRLVALDLAALVQEQNSAENLKTV